MCSATYISTAAKNATITLTSAAATGYNVYFWSSELFTGTITNPTGADQPAATTMGYIFSCLSMNYPVATAGTGSKLNGNVALSSVNTSPRHTMMNVRCVRDKK